MLQFTKWNDLHHAIVLHGSTSVVTVGSNGSIATQSFINAYNVIEKIQMTGFWYLLSFIIRLKADQCSLQEFIISTIYIRETTPVLKSSLRPQTKNIMQQLIYINILIMIPDVGLLSIEYASLFLFETILKGFVYSLKLKLEFTILGWLVDAVGGPGCERGQGRAASFSTHTIRSERRDNFQDLDDVAQFVDLKKVSTGYRFAASATIPDRPRSSTAFEGQHIEHVRPVLASTMC